VLSGLRRYGYGIRAWDGPLCGRKTLGRYTAQRLRSQDEWANPAQNNDHIYLISQKNTSSSNMSPRSSNASSSTSISVTFGFSPVPFENKPAEASCTLVFSTRTRGITSFKVTGSLQREQNRLQQSLITGSTCANLRSCS